MLNDDDDDNDDSLVVIPICTCNDLSNNVCVSLTV